MISLQKMALFLVATAPIGALGSSCNPSTDSEDSQYGQVVQSARLRELSPTVDQADLAELVAGNSEFACELYQFLAAGDGNLFYSPYSISLALAMTYAGARGQTETQMADTLDFTLPQERLHPAFNALDLALASRGEGAAGADDQGFRLNIANAIWGQRGFAFLTDFLDVLAINYGAGLRVLDFATEPEPSRLIINDWVSDETEEKIQNLIPEGMITPLTRLVLTNAIYFNAAWQYPFEEASTADGTFYLLDAAPVTVPMMSQTEYFRYTDGEGYQAIELPYDGSELSMIILLPDAGGFDAFEDALDASQLDLILSSLASTHVALTMPTFDYESEFSLKTTLAAMGMPDAFDPEKADFSGMTGRRDLAISEVLHKAFVSVDEAGTEAAAATAVIIIGTVAVDGGTIVEVTVDRPFIFLIRDIETGAILFIGRVVNPA